MSLLIIFCIAILTGSDKINNFKKLSKNVGADKAKTVMKEPHFYFKELESIFLHQHLDNILTSKTAYKWASVSLKDR